MLYEKTLNRKILGAKQMQKDEEPSNVISNGHANGHLKLEQKWYHSLLGFFKRVYGFVISPFRSRKAAKKVTDEDAASMGKILNIMK